jgi:thymidine kinase
MRPAALDLRCSARVADARRAPQVLELVPHADGVSKLSGRCPRCHKPSLFSLRTVAGARGAPCAAMPALLTRTFAATDSRRELVGGSEAYQPACRACYNELHRVDEHPPALKPAAAQTPGVSR